MRHYWLEDAPVTLRESLAIENMIVGKHWNNGSDSIVGNEITSVLAVTQDFLW